MSDTSQEIKFEAGEEYCADALGPVTVMLQSGNLEYYGTPLEESVEYSFPIGTTLLLRSPKTATNETVALITGRISPQPETRNNCVYSAALSRFNEYLNAIRADAERSGSFGPSVLVCGPKDVGKGMFCRLLCNSAIESDFHVKYIDLNTEPNSITFPRHIAAVTMEDFFPVSAFLDTPCREIYAFDYAQPPEDTQGCSWTLLRNLCLKMHTNYRQQATKSKELRSGGIIVKAPNAFFPGTSEESAIAHPLMPEIMDIFDIQYVCFIGQGENLIKKVQKLKCSPLLRMRCVFQHFPFVCKKSILPYLPNETEDSMISSYFTGTDVQLQCFKVSFEYGNLSFFRSLLKSETLKQNDRRKIYGENVVSINLDDEYDEYIGRIASLTDARSPEDVHTARIVGFFVISSVDPKTGRVCLVSPTPEPLQYTNFFVSQLTTTIPELLFS